MEPARERSYPQRTVHRRCSKLIILLAMTVLVGGCRHELDPGTLRAGGNWTAPPVYHGNPFGFGGVGAAYHFVFEPLFCYIPATGEWLPRLAESFEDIGDTTIVHLRPDAMWHDGQPVTAEDVRASLLLLVLRGHPLATFCESIEATDLHTLTFRWRYRTEDLKAYVFAELIFVQARRFPEPLSVMDEFYQLHLQSEREAPQELKDRIAKARLEMIRDHPKFPIGTGPFRMTKITASEMVFEKFQQHPLASRMPYNGLRLFKVGSNEVGWALLLSAQIDFMAMSCPIDLVEEIQHRHPNMELALPEDGSEVGFVFNTRTLDLPLRKALVSALDRDVVRLVAFPFANTTNDVGLGVSDSKRAGWFTPEELAAFPPRPTNLAMAVEGLTQGGYKKVDGHWNKPDGNALELTIACEAGRSDFILMAEAAAAQWDAFGIPTQIRVVQSDIYPEKLKDGDFQVTATFGIMHGRFTTPISGLERFFYQGNEIQQATGLPESLSVDGETVVPGELILALRREQDPEKLHHGIFQLCRTLYDQVVYVPIFEKRTPMFYQEGGVVTNWPSPDSPYWSGVVSGAEQVYINILLFGDTRRTDPS